MAIPKPSAEEIIAEATKPGTTFAGLARKWAVAPKTAKRWCKDAGIEKLGQPKESPEDEIKAAQGNIKPGMVTREEAIELKNQMDHVLKTIQTLEVETAKLWEENEKLRHELVVMGKELDRERKARVEIFDKIKAEVQKIGKSFGGDETSLLWIEMLNAVIDKINMAGDGKVQDFTKEELTFYMKLKTLINYATRGLASKLEHHHHTVLSIAEGKERAEQRRMAFGDQA